MILLDICAVFICIMLFAIWRAMLGGSAVNYRFMEIVKKNAVELNKNTKEATVANTKMEALTKTMNDTKKQLASLGVDIGKFSEGIWNDIERIIDEKLK